MALQQAPAILLHTPQLGENIGAAARVMLNFGLTDLRLVSPRDGWPSASAEAMSAGALGSGVEVSVFATLEAAIAADVDVFITGEISEPQAHYARECGVSFIACGHHASERYGAPAVAGHVAQRLGLRHSFIDIDNPA